MFANSVSPITNEDTGECCAKFCRHERDDATDLQIYPLADACNAFGCACGAAPAMAAMLTLRSFTFPFSRSHFHIACGSLGIDSLSICHLAANDIGLVWDFAFDLNKIMQRIQTSC